MSDWKLCYGCMEPLGDNTVCAHCGYDRETTSLANYIKPGTLLHDRFLVGKVLAANGEGVTYIGFDTAVECKILIREYFPEQLCKRVPNSAVIDVGYEHLAQYKALMAEYTELNKALARLRNLSHLNPALDMFADNNTTYAVYEYLEGRTLLDYLKENAGELSWNTVRQFFPPLFTTLSLLHNAGVLHRGLSPETIFVTDKGEIKLTGFCISAVRTNDTELDAELFDGYAAPEQYFADRQQGTWTDVYGICAVLYRILTGCRATDAISRQDYDILVPPIEINPKIPENVSKGIMHGLELDGNARVRTITDLVTLLFEEETVPEPEQAVESIIGRPKKNATAVFTPQQSPRIEEIHSGQVTQQRPRNPQGTQQRPHSGQGQRRQGQTTQQRSHSGNPQRRSGQVTQQRSHNGNPQQRRPNGQRPPQHPQGNRPPQRRRPDSGRQSAKAQEYTIFERVRAPLLIAFLFIAIVIVVIWAFIRVWDLGAGGKHLDNSRDKSSSASDNIIPAQTDEQGRERTPDAYIPDLVGKSFTVKRDEYAGWLDLEPEYEFSDSIAKDLIMWQEFEPDSEFVSGSSMKVKVSLGSSIITIPPFKGLRLNSYLKKLENMGLVEATDGGGNNNMATGGFVYSYGNGQGFVVTTAPPDGSPATTTQATGRNGKNQVVRFIATIDYEYTNGYVCKVEPEPGKIIDALDDYEIIVYYAYNPVVYTGTMMTSSTNSTASTSSGALLSTGKTTYTTAVTTKTTAKVPETTAPPETLPPPVTEAPKTDPPRTDPPKTDPPKTDPPAPPPTDPPAPVTQAPTPEVPEADSGRIV